MGYFNTTIKAASWSMATRWTIRGMTFIRLAILARILLPSQFGIFGIATLVLGLLDIITETWINVFLVQEEGKIDKFVDTAWTISIFRGFVIALIIFLSSGLISQFFNSADSLPVIRATALIPLTRGFINPSEAKLQKYLRFKTEFVFRSFLFVIDAGIAIAISVITRNAIGLVIGMFSSALLEVILSLIIFRPVPKIRWSKTAADLIIRRGRWITAAGILNYAYQNGDNIIVGRMMGATSLGLYDPAYKISGLPVSEISDVLARVTFPVFVRLREDNTRLHKAFARTLAVSNIITTFGGVLIFVFSRQLILVALGPNWLPALPALKILSVCGITKAFISSVYPLFLATKNQQYVTWVTLTSSFFLLLTIIPAVGKFGLAGAGLSATLGSLLSAPLALYYVKTIFKTRGRG